MTINNAANILCPPIPKSPLLQETKKEATVPVWNGEQIIRELERIRDEVERESKGTNDLGKAVTIMMRIIKGDIVPDADDKFLLENYPEMHMKAWLLRQQKEEPHEYDSVLEDDGGNVFFEVGTALELDVIA
jgi:hypothetical protein